MKLVYIAGPYRAENRLKVRWNIIKAKQRGVQVILQCLNCYPVIPHMNTAGEVARAELLGLPVFRTLTDLKRWANSEQGLARNAGA